MTVVDESMLFNSLLFILAFLPVTWMLFVALAARNFRVAIAWLCLASFAFYGYSSLYFLAIMLASVTANFALASLLVRAREKTVKRLLLTIGIAGNLTVIGYFKYINFVLDNVGGLLGLDVVVSVVLPLGISFYTFQKIVLLVDIYRGDVRELDPLGYVFFISFFPQLIAGPIVHYAEIVPQLTPVRRDRVDDIVSGGSIFIIGLFKKVVIADSIAVPSSRFFNGVAGGAQPDLVDAWLGSLCYGLQIYYDFSAYSDMAVGLGRMFGINLPINFASPYKARSIIDFWRRWHITLSRLLRDYLYVPLGGGRHGAMRRSTNLLVTMLIGGAWHGAAWAYVVWGGLHGILLLVNHAWSGTRLAQSLREYRVWHVAAAVITIVCVIIAWVPFRTGDLEVAITIWKAMLGFGLFDSASTAEVGARGAIFALLLLIATLVMPNSYEIMNFARLGTPTRGYPSTYLESSPWLVWTPALRWAVVLGAMLGLAVVKMNDASEFIYFQF